MAEEDRRIVTLPYGEGLERSKGQMVVSPLTFDDLRNVFQFDGKAQVRQGLALASVLVDDGPTDLDVTVMLEPLRSETASMGVGYNTNGTSNREVWLNRMEIDGSNPFAVGLLGTLDEGVTFVPPLIIGADSDNKFFIAHDEPNPTSRLVTQVYDPRVFPNLTDLQADLDGDGQADVFFRGVVRHLSYIFGWGFGNASDPVRGDVVRVSNSGDSSIFEDFAFFEAGQQGETVMVCRSAGPTLMVFKETETYEIFGYSPDTFGIRLADSLFGAVGSRLAVSVAGTVFFWSTQGPRLTSGGPSIDIAVPLDIDGPDPATLVAESEPQDAFAVYDPRTRVVQFVWGQRVYALSIRDPNRPRWSYYELGETAQSSGLFFATQSQAGGGGPPIGAPENLVFDANSTGTLTLTGQPLENETVTITGKAYRFQTVLTDVDGNVLIGATPSDSLDNLIAAINLGPGAGVDYAALTTVHPTVTAAAGVGDTMDITVTLSGSAGNSTSTTTNLTNGSWGAATTTGGVGSALSTEVEIEFDNIDQIGAEDVEVHVSDDGGANYTFSGRFGANALPTQLITVLFESQPSKKIQPLTDYKFSLRYVLGGLHSPGYTSDNPDDWPAASQGLKTTTAGVPLLIQRVGDNEGVWDRINDTVTQIRVPVELPAGHELIDVEVFLEIQEAGPVTDPDDFSPPFRFTVIQADTLRAIWNSASPGYPNTFIDEYTEGSALPSPQTEKLNIYRLRFRKGANIGSFSVNTLTCYAGPDPQPIPAFTLIGSKFEQGLEEVLIVGWTNATTPTDPRTCPPIPPPALHLTLIFARNVTQGGSWELQSVPSEGQFQTQGFPLLSFNVDVGDVVNVAIRHQISCFDTIVGSDWALAEQGSRFISFTVT